MEIFDYYHLPEPKFHYQHIQHGQCVKWTKTHSSLIKVTGEFIPHFFPHYLAVYEAAIWSTFKVWAWAYRVCRNWNCLNATLFFPYCICCKGIISFFELPWNTDDKYWDHFIFPPLGAELACLLMFEKLLSQNNSNWEIAAVFHFFIRQILWKLKIQYAS